MASPIFALIGELTLALVAIVALASLVSICVQAGLALARVVMGVKHGETEHQEGD